MISVKEALPENWKEVAVKIDEELYIASRGHGEWILSENTKRKLNVMDMADAWDWAQKITHWRNI